MTYNQVLQKIRDLIQRSTWRIGICENKSYVVHLSTFSFDR